MFFEKMSCFSKKCHIARHRKVCYVILNLIRSERDRDSQVVVFSGNRKGVMPMNTMEVLTLLLVVFAALSYINFHRK